MIVPNSHFQIESKMIPVTLSVTGSESIRCPNPKMRKGLSRRHKVRVGNCRSERNSGPGMGFGLGRGSDAFCLRRDEARLSAAPADVGALPIPMKPRKDFTVVVGDPAKTEIQPRKKSQVE
jgi:hypothetical protein